MPYQPPAWTQIVAHRGNSGPLPQNTRIAIESAIEMGVDMVEVDVRLTRDGVLVLMHDAAVDHTTSGTGLVEDLTWDEIQSLDAGGWMDPAFAGEPVPSLGEVLQLCRGRVAVNIDTKTPSVVIPVMAAIDETGLADNVVITGCNAECVQAVTSTSGDISTLFNLDEVLEGIEPAEAGEVARHSIDVAKELGAVAINLHHMLVDASLIARAAEVGIGVWAFTVDDELRFGEMIDMGVTSLTTNWPARMLEVARERPFTVMRPRAEHAP